MMNKVMLIGRLGADPEVRYTPDGTMVTNFNMATDETWKDKTGQKQQRTEWHRIEAWGKLAEICAEYLKKGSLIFIEGKIKTQDWEDKEGVKRYTTKINAMSMKMLGAKPEGAQTEPSGPAQQEARDFVPGEIPDDDVLFWGDHVSNDQKCPICQGAGFKSGKICVCISGMADDDILKSLLGVFDRKDPEKWRPK